jgi:uncharacterized Zn-binding protein involved in type VI secretion
MNRLFSILFLIFLLTCVFASQVLAGQPAARVNDLTSAGCLILNGSTDVFINGLRAARETDSLTCAGTITQGSNTVIINGLPAARMGDTVRQTIYVPWPEPLDGTITVGSPNVEIGG